MMNDERATANDSQLALAQGGGAPATLLVPRSSFLVRRSWLKWLLIGIVVMYIGVLILAPLAALVAGAFSGGVGAIVAALSQPDVLSAFWRTLLISLIVVCIHVVCGTAVAWVLVRHNFRGRRI